MPTVQEEVLSQSSKDHTKENNEPLEAQGSLAESNLSLPQKFVRDGFLILRSVLPLSTVQDWSNTWGTDDYFHQIFLQLHKLGRTPFPTHHKGTEYALGRGIPHGFREIVMRSPGRYEIALTDNDDSTILQTLQHHLPWIPTLLHSDSNDNNSWDNIQCISTSLLVATPGAVDQGWHTDGPCPCLNVCIPLTKTITPAHGPTELRPGSVVYRGSAARVLVAAARKTLRDSVLGVMEWGDVLVFDYRVMHRGRANTTERDHRVMLVVTLALPGMRDVLNFPRRSMWDEAA